MRDTVEVDNGQWQEMIEMLREIRECIRPSASPAPVQPAYRWATFDEWDGNIHMKCFTTTKRDLWNAARELAPAPAPVPDKPKAEPVTVPDCGECVANYVCTADVSPGDADCLTVQRRLAAAIEAARGESK